MNHLEKTEIPLGVKISKDLIVELAESCKDVLGSIQDVRVSVDNVSYDNLEEFIRCYYEKEIQKWHVWAADLDTKTTILIINAYPDKLNVSVEAGDSVRAQELLKLLVKTINRVPAIDPRFLLLDQVSKAPAQHYDVKIPDPINVVLSTSAAERSYTELKNVKTFRDWIKLNKYEIIKGIIFAILGGIITYVITIIT